MKGKPGKTMPESKQAGSKWQCGCGRFLTTRILYCPHCGVGQPKGKE